MTHEITVHVRGGYVAEISDIPEGTVVTVLDWDNYGDDGETPHTSEWTSQEHDPDCECGICTGEDKALEAMERGISACENTFEVDSDNPDAGEYHVF